ncbi:MAG: proline--tRNA ligase [Acidobacteria bacterium RIFCSPLOWO2_12_FULL_54_10]|nr:MAG: proline--tRNA ligase [Acidobacteria bacterium RIFCSPLOWO2_12_FULL_54_10]
MNNTKTKSSPNQKITPRSQDFARWYQDVILQADLAEPAEVVKGCMVIKPHGYAIWEALHAELDARFKQTGHKNAYFPLLIPESFLKREAEHVEGFAPELAVVTIAGGENLEERYVIRPTSETIIGHFFARWIKSWRDLPLLINQWANVVRWELRTRMFLRTTEFLWQEGHTAHATEQEAHEETLRMLNVYADVAENVMAMPVIRGVKTKAEKFAGAAKSYCIEAMMQNGLALQAGTSHELGQNFAKVFEIRFQSQSGNLEYVWQTSWGVSTRLIGALVMSHSDDRGLVLPPKLAPIHVVVIPIYRKDEERALVLDRANRIADELKQDGHKVQVDDRDGYTPGSKFFHWEQRGIPLLLEIGPREVQSDSVVMRRRDEDNKQSQPVSGLRQSVRDVMNQMQADLLLKARKRLDDNTVQADSFDQVKSILEGVTSEKGGGKFIAAHVKDDPQCDAKLKEIKASVRCIPLHDAYDGPGTCIITGEPTPQRVIVAKAY